MVRMFPPCIYIPYGYYYPTDGAVLDRKCFKITKIKLSSPTLENRMTAIGDYYATIDTDHIFPNDSISASNNVEIAEFDHVISSMFFTPDHDTDAEDLQFRVSKDVKFFLGSNDANTSDSNYTLALKDHNDIDQLEITTSFENIRLTAEKVSLNSVDISQTATASRISSKKVLQIATGETFDFTSVVEFKNTAKFDKNVYLDKMLIFQQNSYGGESNEQTRIAFQYNAKEDTVDLIKQKGVGVNAEKRLMARLGMGGIQGGSTLKGVDLENIPYYRSVSQMYEKEAPAYEDIFDTWIDANTDRIDLGSFSNDIYIPTIQNTPIHRKWRFRETDDHENMIIEKLIGTEWVSKFDFADSVVYLPALYAFSTHTFTNASAQYRYGPTLIQMLTAYGNVSPWNNPEFFNEGSFQGYQVWTVPETARYTIKLYGARGGSSQPNNVFDDPTHPQSRLSNPGGNGAWTEGDFTLSRGEKRVIIVGQEGDGRFGANNPTGGGGGGASWFLSEDLGTLYAVAGGGGGTNSTDGTTLPGYGTDGGISQATGDSTGGVGYPEMAPGGGAGFDFDGGGVVSAGVRPAAGAYGGDHGYGSYYDRVGGFGGGGGSGGISGGGGGGFQGGDTNAYQTTPGGFGGTSKNNGLSITFGTHTGTHGYVVITRN